ncbi:hypothetical protein AB9P05_00365 [Roseivirga sp. BDSF3-8]|uniref:hypothetical protein n=1 Tax=Roseivirga sp. BDSF3-8 TaxID=3241598 RepID=UPI0035321FBE
MTRTEFLDFIRGREFYIETAIGKIKYLYTGPIGIQLTKNDRVSESYSFDVREADNKIQVTIAGQKNYFVEGSANSDGFQMKEPGGLVVDYKFSRK